MARLLADLTPLRESAPFRRLWIGNSVGTVGQQMTSVAVALQVYDLTGTSFAVGLTGLFQLVPLIVLGLYGGALLDRFDRRKVALIATLGLWFCTLAFVAQALLHVSSVPLLYGIIAVQAGFFAVSNPARQAIIPRLIPGHLLPAANALNTLTWSIAFTLGPVVGGLLIAGAGTVTVVYLLDLVVFAIAVWAMWRLPALPPEGVKAGAARGWASVLEGLRFLKGKRNLQMSFYLDIVAMVFGMPRALFPAVATMWFGGSVADVALIVGLLSAAPAVGSFIASVFSGPLGRVQRQGLAVVISIMVWGSGILVFGFMRWLPAALLALAVAGAADTVSAIFRSTILQAATPDEYRGRLQGIFTVVVVGGPRLGDVESGAVAAVFGEAVSAVSGGLLCIVFAGLLVAAVPTFLRYDAQHPTP
ncbi:MAG: MFS transporter [Candidatus Nanopelagicales bacterium]